MGKALPGKEWSAGMLWTMGALQPAGMHCMGMEAPGQACWAAAGMLGMPGTPAGICMAMNSPPLTAMGGGGMTPTGGIIPGGICDRPICARATHAS